MMSLPLPTPEVAVALASIAVHAREALSPNGHHHDLAAVNGLVEMPNVQAYLAELDALALLPVVRAEKP